MIIKLVVLAAVSVSYMPHQKSAPETIEMADGEGDLNPQPLPPIAEEGFAFNT